MYPKLTPANSVIVESSVGYLSFFFQQAPRANYHGHDTQLTCPPRADRIWDLSDLL